MSMLMQLLIGREIARRSGVEDSAGQMRIGALAAVVPNPMLGLVVAKVASDREAPARVVQPGDGGKPGEPPDSAKPPADERPAPVVPAKAKA